MPYTAEEQEKFFMQCYGCNPNNFKQSVEDSITFKISGPGPCIESILSDAQEELALGMVDEARMTINRAKFLIAEYFIEGRG